MYEPSPLRAWRAITMGVTRKESQVTKKLKVAASGIIAVLLQWALAISAWGGWRPFFSHRAFIALAAVTLVLIVVAPFTGGNFGSGVKEDRANRWFIPVLICLVLLNAWVPAFTDRRGFLTIDGDGTRWLGVVLFAAGGSLRLWAIFVLGRRFSGLVAIQAGHSLETRGVYSLVRNPAYVGMLIHLLGWALAFRSGAGLVLVALAVIPVSARIRAEERLLRDHFGVEYDSYFARTWRLIPWIY